MIKTEQKKTALVYSHSNGISFSSLSKQRLEKKTRKNMKVIGNSIHIISVSCISMFEEEK